MRSDLLAQLADVLAGLYGDAASARTIATTAGLNLAQIAFDAKATNTWTAILIEAELQGRTSALLDRARDQYPNYARLQQARQAYDDGVAASRPGHTPATTPQQASPPPRRSGTIDYKLGFNRLRTCLETNAPDQLIALATLEDRFQRNQRSERVFGATPETKSEHAQVVYALNELALEVCGVSFNEMGSRE
jgi:hypothetical protein